MDFFVVGAKIWEMWKRSGLNLLLTDQQFRVSAVEISPVVSAMSCGSTCVTSVSLDIPRYPQFLLKGVFSHCSVESKGSSAILEGSV